MQPQPNTSIVRISYFSDNQRNAHVSLHQDPETALRIACMMLKEKHIRRIIVLDSDGYILYNGSSKSPQKPTYNDCMGCYFDQSDDPIDLNDVHLQIPEIKHRMRIDAKGAAALFDAGYGYVDGVIYDPSAIHAQQSPLSRSKNVIQTAFFKDAARFPETQIFTHVEYAVNDAKNTVLHEGVGRVIVIDGDGERLIPFDDVPPTPEQPTMRCGFPIVDQLGREIDMNRLVLSLDGADTNIALSPVNARELFEAGYLYLGGVVFQP